MKEDDNSMNSVELAIFNQVRFIFEQHSIYQVAGLRPIVVKTNGAFASLTVACPRDLDQNRFASEISEAVSPLGVTKITYRPVSDVTVEAEKPKEATSVVPDPITDPFADFSFSVSGR